RPAAPCAAGTRGREARPAGAEPRQRRRGSAEGHARAERGRHRHRRDSRGWRLGENRAVTWVGQPLLRREDLPLLTGRGRSVEDARVTTPRHVAFARSPWAHAELSSVDVSAALGLPGVAAAVTGAELAQLTDPFAAGITHELGYYALAVDRARYAGEPVA